MRLCLFFLCFLFRKHVTNMTINWTILIGPKAIEFVHKVQSNSLVNRILFVLETIRLNRGVLRFCQMVDWSPSYLFFSLLILLYHIFANWILRHDSIVTTEHSGTNKRVEHSYGLALFIWLIDAKISFAIATLAYVSNALLVFMQTFTYRPSLLAK